MAKTYRGEEIAAGDILQNTNNKFQGVVSVVLGRNIWLTEEAELLHEVDFGSRKHLLNENTIQLRQYELIKKGGENP